MTISLSGCMGVYTGCVEYLQKYKGRGISAEVACANGRTMDGCVWQT